MIESVNPRLIFLILFTLTLTALMWKDRKNVNRHSILFYRRTEKGIEIIDKIAKKLPKFWNIYGWTGVILGLLSIPFILINLGLSFREIFVSQTGDHGVSLILPGLSGESTFQSGVSFVPIEYWVLSIAVLMFFHELSHGIVARSENFEINSVGWIVLGIIPGAFVEPKGEQMLPGDELNDSEKASAGLWDQGNWKSRLKVLCAGSFANYLVAILATVLALGLFSMVAHPEGVYYLAQDDYPAQEVGMNNGTIYSVNGERVRYAEELSRFTEEITPGEEILLETSEGNFTVTTTDMNGSAYVGISMYRSQGITGLFNDMVYENRVIKDEYANYSNQLGWTLGLLQMMALLNLLIGLFNMLPIKPLDGGQVIDTLFERFVENGSRTYLNYFSLLLWILILGVMFYSIATAYIL